MFVNTYLLYLKKQRINEIKSWHEFSKWTVERLLKMQ